VPLHLPVGLHDSLPERALIGPFDEMRDYFGIRLAGERVSLILQRGPQAQIVLHDAVEHDGEAAGAVGVRMGVLGRRPPVSGPPRVSNPQGALVSDLIQNGLQVVQVADRVEEFEPVVTYDGQARGIVTAVLELP